MEQEKAAINLQWAYLGPQNLPAGPSFPLVNVIETTKERLFLGEEKSGSMFCDTGNLTLTT